MLWASFSKDGYAGAIAYSDNWENRREVEPRRDRLLFSRDGGHGMVFRDLDGKLRFVLHRPNRTPDERAVFFELCEKDDSLWIK